MSALKKYMKSIVSDITKSDDKQKITKHDIEDYRYNKKMYRYHIKCMKEHAEGSRAAFNHLKSASWHAEQADYIPTRFDADKWQYALQNSKKKGK